MKPTSLILSLFLFALLILPFWYEHRTENLKISELYIGTYSSSGETMFHYSTETNTNKTILIWSLIFSIFAIGSLLNFFGVNLGLGLLIGLIGTFGLMLGLSFIQPAQIINIPQNTTSVIK